MLQESYLGQHDGMAGVVQMKKNPIKATSREQKVLEPANCANAAFA